MSLVLLYDLNNMSRALCQAQGFLQARAQDTNAIMNNVNEEEDGKQRMSTMCLMPSHKTMVGPKRKNRIKERLKHGKEGLRANYGTASFLGFEIEVQYFFWRNNNQISFHYYPSH